MDVFEVPADVSNHHVAYTEFRGGVPRFEEPSRHGSHSPFESTEFGQQGFPGLTLASHTHQWLQPCNRLLELAIKRAVGFRAQQLLPKGNTVADGKVSRIVRTQDTNRARYERRNDWHRYGDGFADNVRATLQV